MGALGDAVEAEGVEAQAAKMKAGRSKKCLIIRIYQLARAAASVKRRKAVK